VFHTTAGDVTFRAYRALSPKGADRLHTLVRHGYYDGSALYRVLPGFVAQFGVAADPSLARVYDHRENHPGAILEDEPAIINPDGPGNDKLWLSYSSAYDDTKSPPRAVNRTAELFVNLVDNREKLDEKGFASFARVVRGSEVIDKWFAGYGEMREACDLHPDGGWVCEGPSETDLYARGVEAYVDEAFSKTRPHRVRHGDPRPDRSRSGMVLRELEAPLLVVRGGGRARRAVLRHLLVDAADVLPAHPETEDGVLEREEAQLAGEDYFIIHFKRL
jgi:cyclophilin family peptidyl-prolyl cis-trans isomerase